MDGQLAHLLAGREALLTLEQDGDRVTGTYEPGGGRIEARVESEELRGTWTDGTLDGTLIFALSQDDRSFAGRFGNGDWWNGERVSTDDRAAMMPIPPSYATPRTALQSVLIASNESSAGNVAAPLWFGRGLAFAGEFTDNRDWNRRRMRFLQLLDLCTIRLVDVPEEAQRGVVEHPVGTAGTDWRFDLRFSRHEDGGWRVVVPTLERIETLIDQALASVGADDYGSWNLERLDSPRYALRAFIDGCARWAEGGATRARAVMDLSAVPVQFRDRHGEFVAEYLWQIINRVGWVVWQEIPDDPTRRTEYVFYRHAQGNIALVPQPTESGVAWRLAPETIAAAPDIYHAIRSLPIAHDRAVPSFSRHFLLRSRIQAVSPALVRRDLWLENWQWLALVATPVAAGLASLVGGWLLGLVLRRTPLKPGDRRGVVGSVRLATFSGVVLLGLAEVGLPGAVITAVSIPFLLLLIAGVTWLLLKVAGVAGGAIYTRAERTPGQVDEIVTSLGTAVVKIVVVVAAILVAGKLLGIPYEGMLAGLSISGLALAIAARDTISNFFGAAIMIADRPFKRGDLVDVDGQLAVVENVGLRSSRLRRLDDALLTIPNGRLSDHIVINLGRRRKRLVVLQVGFTYDTPREKLDGFVTEAREVVGKLDHVDSDFHVGLTSFGESSLDFEVRASFWVSTYAEHVRMRHELVAELVSLAERLEMEFAFPTRTLHMAGREEEAAERDGTAPGGVPALAHETASDAR